MNILESKVTPVFIAEIKTKIQRTFGVVVCVGNKS